MKGRWPLGSCKGNATRRRTNWWHQWVWRVGTQGSGHSSVPVSCRHNLLLADMNCLMLGLSGVSSLATRLIHNTDKPSAVHGKETLYGKMAIESPMSFLTMFFCNFFRQCCLFWLFSDHWNSQMPWGIKSISKLGIYLFSKLKLFLMSLLKLDRAFFPRNHNIFPVFFSSSF